MMRVSNSHPDVYGQNPAVATPKAFRRAYSPADGLVRRDQGQKKEQLVQSRLSHAEGNRKQDGGSFTSVSSQPSYRSCIHFQVPLRSTSSVVFLDKSLSMSLAELEGRRAGQPTSHSSTLFVRLGVSSRSRSSADKKPAQINEGCEGLGEAASGRNKLDVRESGAGRHRSPLSKHGVHKVEQIAPARGVNSKTGDSDMQRHSTALGLLSFRGPSLTNTKAGRQKGNADEAAFPSRSNFRHRQHTSNIGPVDSGTWSKQTRNEETEKPQEHDSSSEPQKVPDENSHLQLNADSLEGTPTNLSLKEALELLRPDFISRSQGRVRRLEQRARRRRYRQDSNPDLVEGLREDGGKQKRNCTTPDPLSDNLFKPGERSISGREMQLRSRRIYNKLPEVTKKKEEEKKRAVTQTNRLRADVFKKRLLDQILQR